MAHPVPDDAQIAVHAIPLALWQTEFTPGTFSEDRSKQTRFQVSFRPVAGAYVAVVRVSSATQSLGDASWKLQLGRTNDFGWMIRRDRKTLGSEQDAPRSGWTKHTEAVAGVPDPLAVPDPGGIEAYPDTTDALDAGVASPEDLATFAPDDPAMVALDSADANAEALSGLPNERYMIVWCYRERLFREFLHDYDIAPAEAMARFQATSYCVRSFEVSTPVSDLRDLSPHEQAFVARVTSKGEEGYHGGWPSRSYMAAAIFDATPRELRTLYLCEWAQWCCVAMVHNDAHWPYLHALRATICSALSGAPLPDLAKDMPTGIIGQRAGQMRAYLHALAWSGWRDVGSVRSLVDVWKEAADVPWRTVAEPLDARYGLCHPMRMEPAPPASEFRFTAKTRDALVAYFRMYRLGFDHKDDLEALDAHWEHVQTALAWIQEKQKTLISRLDSVGLQRAVERSLLPSDERRKTELLQRFHYEAMLHQVPHWEQAENLLKNQSAWDAHKPFVAWMGEGSATLSKVFETLIGDYLGRYQALSSASLEQSVQHLFRYHLALSNEAYEQFLPQHNVLLRLEADAASGKAIAKFMSRGKETVLAELDILTAVEKMSEVEIHRPLAEPLKGTEFKRYRRAVGQGKTRSFKTLQVTVSVYDADAPDLASFPKMLADIASLIKLGIAGGELAAALSEKEFQEIDSKLYISFAVEGLASFEAATDLVRPVLRKLAKRGRGIVPPWVSGTKYMGPAAEVVDAGRNLWAGGSTLATFFSPGTSDTDLAYYLNSDQGLPAFLETIKGVLQVASGAGAWTSMGARILGASLTMASVPLATWVSVGALSVAMLDVLIYLDTGGESPTKDFELAVRDARRQQFFLATGSAKEPILKHDQDAPVTTATAESPAQKATCLLSRRLGLVHHIMQA